MTINEALAKLKHHNCSCCGEAIKTMSDYVEKQGDKKITICQSCKNKPCPHQGRDKNFLEHCNYYM